MRVDYYILQSETLEASQHFLLRLIEKVYHKQHPIRIEFETQTACEAWDALLWAYKPDAFIPHECTAPQTIAIDCPYLTQAPVGINLSLTPWFENLPSRIIEIVFNDPNCREQKRTHYKAYQNKKFDMMVHNLTA